MPSFNRVVQVTMRRFANRSMIVHATAVLALLGAAPFSNRQSAWEFSEDSPGQIAQGFSSPTGRWEVEQDGSNRVLAQRAENRDHLFNLALREDTSYRDVDLSVRIKAVGGENERGGGVVWRAQDADNYYGVILNPYQGRHNGRRPHFRLFKVEAGRRTQLDHAEAPVDSDWHTLRITAEGPEIRGYLDGRLLLIAEDSTFLNVGRIGVWTKSDACTWFDDLQVSSVVAASDESP
jgi:hypothetical protein